MSALLLVAHGSRDPRATASTRSLGQAVAAAAPGHEVALAFLDHVQPTVPRALARLALAGHRSAVVVPLLLTSAYHHRVDLPALLAEARAAGVPLKALQAEVLGPQGAAVDGKLVVALRRRLVFSGYDAIVLAAAGTRDQAGQASVAASAAALGLATGVPCVAAYASAAGPTPGEAVSQLRAAGARRVAMASYFLAPGLLYDRAAASALAAGAVGVAAPLGDAPELVALVLSRAHEATRVLAHAAA